KGRLIEQIITSLPAGAAEISIEVNPGTLNESKMERYRSAGVNRISLGVQSFQDEELKTAGRLHTVSDVFNDFDSLREYGFNNISIDLIAGRPHQRRELWSENLDWVERLLPEHVSVYMLDVEERSAWGRGSGDHPPEDVFADFYLEAAERLGCA